MPYYCNPCAFAAGARWDTQSGSIVEACLKEVTSVMPVIFAKAVPTDPSQTNASRSSFGSYFNPRAPKTATERSKE